MSISLCYWICMLIWLVLGAWAAWPLNGRSAGGGLLLFILLVLLGYKVFGAPIHS